MGQTLQMEHTRFSITRKVLSKILALLVPFLRSPEYTSKIKTIIIQSIPFKTSIVIKLHLMLDAMLLNPY